MCKKRQLITIDGNVCHAIGCPDAHHRDTKTCGMCGLPFEPAHQTDVCCSDICYEEYYGVGRTD